MGAESSNYDTLSFTDTAGLLEDRPILELTDDHKLLCKDNGKWIQALCVKQFVMEQWRMDNMDQKCGHHGYPSIPAFISHVQRLITEMQDSETFGELKRIKALRHKIFDDGICKECALHIVVHLRELLGSNEICTLPNIGQLGSNEICTPRVPNGQLYVNRYEMDYYLDGTNNTTLLVPCMRHLLCNEVILNASNIWIRYLFVDLHMMVHTIDYACNLVVRGERTYEETLDQIDSGFCNLSSHLFQIIRTFPYWKCEHWSFFLGACKHMSHIERYLEFVALQLEKGYYAKHKYGIQCMYCVLILICCAVHEMQSQWFQTRHRNGLTTFDALKLKKWCRRLPGKSNLELSFKCLEQPLFVEEMFKLITGCNQRVRTLKWQDMQCQRGECGHKRSCGELRKCRGCKVVRYCSRYCQKRHWNRHKVQCKKLRSMRRDRTRRVRKVRADLTP